MASVPVGKPVALPAVLSPDRAMALTLTDDPTPWRQLLALLAKQIETGVLEPGDQVAVSLTAADFAIAPRVARKAFAVLVEQGLLITPPPGQGAPYTVAEAEND
jgi:DNA-binding GntR family transcriptional regulator